MNTCFVHSTLAADPDFAELVEMFVQEMPDRIDNLETQAGNRNWELLARAAHQLKGAGGSYGFDAITPRALRLETAAKNAEPDDQILLALSDLLDICRRMRPGVTES